MEKEFTKVCPQCGSDQLKLPTTPWKNEMGLFFEHYSCQECKYEGHIIEATPEMQKEIKTQWNKKNK